MKDPAPSEPAGSDHPALPLFPSWTGVYLFVLVTFALWLTLLIALTEAYS